MKTFEEIENIYKEIAEDDKRLSEDFLSISFKKFGQDGADESRMS